MPVKKKEKEEKRLEFPDRYYVVGADLSLRRPGFSLLYIENNKIKKVYVYSVDNKTKNKTHGQILYEIADCFCSVVPITNLKTFLVREHVITNTHAMSERSLDECVGVMNYLAYDMNYEWNEIYPVTIKKLITGNGKAEKSQVAECLKDYVGNLEYQNDDESDAVACAVSFLLQNKQIEEVKHD